MGIYTCVICQKAEEAEQVTDCRTSPYGGSIVCHECFQILMCQAPKTPEFLDNLARAALKLVPPSGHA